MVCRCVGFRPYFDESFYVGFELGLQPLEPEGTLGGSSIVAYWGVEDADEALDRLLEMGAKEHSAIQDVGGGIRIASVRAPDGNAFGIIENPHFSLGSP